MAAASGTPPLSVHTRWRAGTAAVTISGELDVCTRPSLMRLLSDVLAQRPERLVLDLAQVTFMDCGSARALAVASRALPGTGKAVISQTSRPAGRILRLTGMSSCFTIAGGLPGYRPPAAGATTGAR
jgi:anti-anti-sigma factor